MTTKPSIQNIDWRIGSAGASGKEELGIRPIRNEILRFFGIIIPSPGRRMELVFLTKFRCVFCSAHKLAPTVHSQQGRDNDV